MYKLAKMPSHYCRKSTTKMELQMTFQSMSDLHRAYMEKCADKQKKPLSYQVFSQEFKESNLALFSPKKDQCDICTSLDSGNLTEAEYSAHQKRRAAARAVKDKDKETALNPENKVCVLYMDL